MTHPIRLSALAALDIQQARECISIVDRNINCCNNNGLFRRHRRFRYCGADVQGHALPSESARYSRVTDDRLGAIINRDITMGPQNRVILDDDVLEAVKQRAEAEGKTLDQATNDVVRLGLSEARWQRVVQRGRDYGRENMGAVSDEEAIQIAVDAVHESRAEQRGR